MLLLLGVLATRWNRGNPVNWAQAQADRMTRVLGTLSERLRPDVSITMIPAGEDASDPLLSQVRQAAANTSPEGALAAGTPPQLAAAQDVAAAATSPQAGAPPAAPEQVPPATTGAITATAVDTPPPATLQPPPITQPAPTATPAASPAATSTPPLATRSATPTSTATAAATATPTLSTTVDSGLFDLPTPTPLVVAATSVPTAVPELYKVRSGDTLFDIANRYDLSVDELLAANQLTEDDVYTIQPGDELTIPAPTPMVDATPAATAAKQTYTIRSGDTLLAIALRLGVTIEDLRAANNMSVTQGRVLRPGDELVIPSQTGAEPLATSTPTDTPAPTATTTPTATAPVTPTPTPTAVSAIRLDAPLLRAPENNASVSCNEGETLVWQPVPSIKSTDQYMIHLGYVKGLDSDGAEEVVWVLAQPRASAATSWQLDNGLCGLAPLEFGRQWRWYVDVAEKTTGGTQPVSSPSAIWRFTWQ